MKKKFEQYLLVVVIVILGLGPGRSALALQPSFPCPDGLACGAPSNDPTVLVNGTIAQIINWLLGFAFSLAVLFVIIGGFWYIISAGNEESAEKARGTIINALIGVVLIILSYVIINAVATTFSGGAALAP